MAGKMTQETIAGKRDDAAEDGEGDLIRLEVPSHDDLAYRKWCELLEYGWGHVLLRRGKYRTI